MTLTPEKISALRATTQREFDKTPRPELSMILSLLDELDKAAARIEAVKSVLENETIEVDWSYSKVVEVDDIRDALAR